MIGTYTFPSSLISDRQGAFLLDYHSEARLVSSGSRSASPDPAPTFLAFLHVRKVKISKLTRLLALREGNRVGLE